LIRECESGALLGRQPLASDLQHREPSRRDVGRGLELLPSLQTY